MHHFLYCGLDGFFEVAIPQVAHFCIQDVIEIAAIAILEKSYRSIM